MAVRQRLQSALNRLGDPVGEVRTERPDALADSASPVVNLYLYQLRLNSFMLNNDLEPEVVRTAAPDGGVATGARLVRHWRTPLRLFYLLSGYGDERALVPQRLMAACVAALHRRPVVDAAAVAAAAALLTGTDPADHAPASSDVSLTFQDMTLDENFRLWTAFKATYALSVGYIADTVIVSSMPEDEAIDLVERVKLQITVPPRQR